MSAAPNKIIVHSARAESLIFINGENLFIDSNVIADLFGRPHKNVTRDLESLMDSGAISRLSIESREYVDSRGKTQPSYRLTERDALVLMPFIGGRQAARGQARLVDEFLKARTELLRIARQKSDPARQLAIREKCAAAGFMTDALVEVRTEQGKNIKYHHFKTEHGLCNWVLAGSFEGIPDDADLDAQSFRKLGTIRRRNAALIYRQLSYPERKDALRVAFPLTATQVLEVSHA